MLDKQIRTRANSFYDGGQAGGDASRAQISICTRFVLKLRVRARIEIARTFAIFFMACVVVTGSANFSLAFDPRLVQPSSEACASRLKLNVPELDDDGKTTIKGPSEVVEFLGVEIRRTDDQYILAAPNKKLAAIEEEMARMASISECVKYSRNIGHVVRWLDAFIIGHAASMAVLADPKSFLDRLEAAKERQLNKLLVEIIGEKALKALNEDRRAILGLQRFQ